MQNVRLANAGQQQTNLRCSAQEVSGGELDEEEREPSAEELEDES